MPAAEAEADREDILVALAAEVGDRRRHVGLDARRGRLGDVVHEREVILALADAGAAAEVVDRDRGMTSLGEAEGKFFVEAVEAANVR